MNHSHQIAVAFMELVELLETMGIKDSDIAFKIPSEPRGTAGLIVTLADLREFVCDLGVLPRDSYQI